MNPSMFPGLESVQPGDVQNYLQSTGWTFSRRIATDIIELSRTISGSTVAVRVLFDRSYSDYEVRTAELIELLAKLEQRPFAEVLDDLLTPPGDRVRFRVLSESTRSGSISLQDSLRLRSNARQLLLAAAHSAISPQRHFTKLGHAQAVSLVDECLEPQTERGSYVTSLLVPVTPSIASTGNLEEPYARRVTQLLFGALFEASDIYTRGASGELLNREEAGLSSNLLGALAGMRPSGERSYLEVSMSWSRTRPAPSTEQKARFEWAAFPMFKEAARVLRETTPLTGLEIEGYVVRLDRGADPSQLGEVVVATELADFGSLRVHMRLPPESYALATQAHRTGNPVAVLGTLKKKGRAFWLEEPSGFHLPNMAERSD